MKIAEELVTRSVATLSPRTAGAAAIVGCAILLLGCGSPEPRADEPARAAGEKEPEGAGSGGAPRDVWWDRLAALCGNAYSGRLVSEDAADLELAAEVMTMHVRRCLPGRLEIPFHVGENRSRTWVLTRTDEGIQLQHDHRHEDGTQDAVTLYGGLTLVAGSESVQLFPADEFSKELFAAHELESSTANVWSMEIEPGERFSYVLRRPGRHFQVDFSLRATVVAPAAPWGHD